MKTYLNSTNSDKITLFCDHFGYTLEHLTLTEKQFLRLILINYTAMQSLYTSISLTESLLKSQSLISQITSKSLFPMDSIFIAVGILQGIDLDTAEGLIETLTKQIKVESISDTISLSR